MPATAELKDLETELATMVNQAKTLHADIDAREKKGETVPDDDRQKLRNLLDDGTKKRDKLTELKKLQGLDDYVSAPADLQKAIEIARNGGSLRKSWGQMVVESEEFKNNDRRELLPVVVGDFLKLFGGPGGRKSIYSGTDATGGYATINDRQPDILDIARQRPASVLDLVNKSTTNSDAVEYVIMDSRTNNAAVVSEYTGGNFGLKPESNLTIDLKTATVKTIAAWIGASRQILADAPRLRQLIENELTYEVEVKLEDTLVTDILAWSGIQTRVHGSGTRADAGDNIADTLRRAITDLNLEFYRADGIVLHPAQGEGLELAKDDNNNYLHVYDSASARVWRVPVVETPAITAGTALVAAFKLAVTVWDREQTQVLTGQPNDYFLRNAFAVLAELRAAWAVTRPKAVEKVTNLP